MAKSLKTMSAVYDDVESKVSRLIEKMSGHDLTYSENGKTVELSAAPVKDHLHVYSQVTLKLPFFSL